MVGFNTNTVDRIPARQPINSVEIFTVNDFPAAVSGTPNIITLADNITYLLKDIIALPDDTVIRSGFENALFGVNIETTGITGNADFPLIETNGINPISMRNLDITNISVDAAAENLRIVQSVVTGIAQITECQFRVAPVRIVSGQGALFSRTFWRGGSSLIQGGGGGTGGATIALDNLCVFIDESVAVPNGLLQFAENSITNQVVIFAAGFVMQGVGTVGINLDRNASVNVILLSAPVFTSILTEHFGIKAENPDDFNRAIVTELEFARIAGGSGELFLCDPSVSSSVAITVPNGFIFGVAISGTGDGQSSPGPGGNMIVSRSKGTTDEISLKKGLTDTDHLVITAPNQQARGVTWHKGDLYSSFATGAGFIYQHAGFTTSVGSPLTNIPGNVSDITFVGDNLVVCSSVDGLVRVFDGFSLNLLDSFASGFDQAAGITFDGVNLIIKDNQSQTVNVMKGVSATVQYSFEAEATEGRGIADIPGNGLLIADIDAGSPAIDIYDHPVTLDHSSKTWDVLETPDVTLSSDRGGSFFFGDEVVINPLVQGQWTDIAATGLSYSPFSQLEKCFLANELNGEVEWTGIRDRARTVTAQATVERFSSSGVTEIYQISVCIDGIPIADSFATVVLVTGGQAGQTIQTLSTLPIARDLVEGQTIRIQVRNTTGILGLKITSSRISIT